MLRFFDDGFLSLQVLGTTAHCSVFEREGREPGNQGDVTGLYSTSCSTAAIIVHQKNNLPANVLKILGALRR
jgi:hypothetical protein